MARLHLPGLRRRPKHSHWQEIKTDKSTLALAVSTLAIAGAVLAAQYGRLLTRRTHEQSAGVDTTAAPSDLLTAAPAAAVDTVNVAVDGFGTASRSELVLFNLLAGFLGSFALVRLTTWMIKDNRGPFRNVKVGGRHIHHFVPGILIAFASGIAALVVRGQIGDKRIAVSMGIGMGLTFDEAALLLDMRDVYWTREGLLSVQLSLGTMATLGITILTLRILGRGERHQEEAGEIPKLDGTLAVPAP
ncbi:MAG: hypothetical protein JJE13_11200 [Thermoleophilia bacterium]|nr:hypothetical protein [Thermoleophilia bacterium]